MGLASIATVAWCAGIASIACAQAPKTTSFDVTSVKSVAAGGRLGPAPACSGGTYRASNQLLAASFWYAYDIQPFRLANMPEWARSREAIFDIEGKAPAAVSDTQCRLMVQSLLAARFKMVAHRESRITLVYALVVGKDGAKLRKADESSAGNQVKVNGIPAYGGEKGWPISQLADFLSRGFPGTPIIDKTGLEGRYAFEFDFTVEPGTPPGDTMAAAVDANSA